MKSKSGGLKAASRVSGVAGFLTVFWWISEPVTRFTFYDRPIGSFVTI